jgi:tripartite-type tricarboxylate transporter receptor subunit TctC
VDLSLAALLGEKVYNLGELLGHPVLVENRPGGNTIVGGEYVARAAPDGNTILMSAGTTLTINPVVVKNLSYKVEDFAPISLWTTWPSLNSRRVGILITS